MTSPDDRPEHVDLGWEYEEEGIDYDPVHESEGWHPWRPVWRLLRWVLLLPVRAYRAISTEQARKIRDLSMSLCALAVIFGVVVIRDQQDESKARGLENQQTLRRLDDLIAKVDAQTSPEAQRRQRDLINEVVDLIGCENRDTLQDLVDLLEERGVLETGVLEVITDECELILAPSTTTSQPR